MIKFVLKIFNLNSNSLQIRSEQRTTSAGTQKCGMSFVLSEFQSGTIKQTSNMLGNREECSGSPIQPLRIDVLSLEPHL
jgi:hypothetical protein